MDDARIAAFVNEPARAGLFLDFDGTLSEIVHVPSAARPVGGAGPLLDRLAARFALVAIVSGRGAAELAEWLGGDVEIWGIHGAEHAVAGRIVLSQRVAPYAELMGVVRDEAHDRIERLDLEGVVVEDKGVMVGMHFRAATDVEKARMLLDEVADELAAKHGLVRAEGRLAYELRPPIKFSKSEVVLARSAELDLRAAMFVGDDLVDLPGFDALDELEEAGAATVRVAVRSDEVPDELLRRADVVVEGPPGVLEFLRGLL